MSGRRSSRTRLADAKRSSYCRKRRSTVRALNAVAIEVFHLFKPQAGGNSAHRTSCKWLALKKRTSVGGQNNSTFVHTTVRRKIILWNGCANKKWPSWYAAIATVLTHITIISIHQRSVWSQNNMFGVAPRHRCPGVSTVGTGVIA